MRLSPQAASLFASILWLALSLTNAFAQAPSRTINLAEAPADLNVTPMPVEVVAAYPQLRVDRPIVLTGAGDGSGRLFIASQ